MVGVQKYNYNLTIDNNIKYDVCVCVCVEGFAGHIDIEK